MSVKITVTLPEELKEEWKEYADQRGMPLSGFIKFAVNTYITLMKKARRKVREG